MPISVIVLAVHFFTIPLMMVFALIALGIVGVVDTVVGTGLELQQEQQQCMLPLFVAF